MALVDTHPSALVLADLDTLDRAEWLELRRTGLGGSDAAAVCGLDRWRSPFEVWLEKTAAPNLPEDEDNEPAMWGRLLEPIVRDQVSERIGHRIDVVRSMMVSTVHPFMLANVDGDIPDLDAIYEGKTTTVWLADEWADDAVPPRALLQGMHYLAVTGRARVVVGALIGGQRLETRTVERDDELIEHLISIESEFWQRVVHMSPPPPDGSKSCTDLLAKLYEVQPEAVATLNPVEVIPLIDRRAEAKDEMKRLEAVADEAENQLKVLLGEREIAIDPDGRTLFTWKQHNRTAVDPKALKADRPDVFDAFSKTTQYRTLRIPKGVTK